MKFFGILLALSLAWQLSAPLEVKPDSAPLPESDFSLTLNGTRPEVRTPDSQLVPLTAAGPQGQGEDLYTGTFTAVSGEIEPLEITVLSGLPVPDLDQSTPEPAPRELATTSEEVYGESQETFPLTPAPNDLEAVLAIAKSKTQTSIAAPRGSVITDIIVDGTPLDLKSHSQPPTTFNFNGEASSKATISLREVESGQESEISIPLEASQRDATMSLSATSTSRIPYKTEFRYATFIPDRRVSVPKVCNPWNIGGTYNGNNRNFLPANSISDSVGYKTKIGITFNWTTRRITNSKYVARTYEYDATGKIKYQATATSSGIRFFDNFMTASYGRSRVNHAVGNPRCWVAGDIWYTAIVDVWKSGIIQVHSRRVKVPAHEYYAKHTSAYWTPLKRQSASSFMCLNINCGTESTKISARLP